MVGIRKAFLLGVNDLFSGAWKLLVSGSVDSPISTGPRWHTLLGWSNSHLVRLKMGVLRDGFGSQWWLELWVQVACWKIQIKVEPKNQLSMEGHGAPISILGGGFKYFLFSPLFGEMIQFDEHIFQMG